MKIQRNNYPLNNLINTTDISEIREAANRNAAFSTEELSLVSASKNGNLKHDIRKMSQYENLCINIRAGYEQVVSLLIQNGANVNEIRDGETALHAAAAAGNSLLFFTEHFN